MPDEVHPAFTRRRFVGAAGALTAMGVLAPNALGARLGVAGAHLSSEGPPIAHAFVSRPDLTPPRITVTTPDRSPSSSGHVFLAPFTLPNPPAPEASGPLIVDRTGQPLWFLPVTSGTAMDLRTQRLRGKRVLTWWQGTVFGGYGGSWVIADNSYRRIGLVRAGNGYKGDLHDLVLTSRGTALITIYNELRHDLTPIGGAADGRVVEGVVQEIDVRTGKVLFEWHSLDHVALEETYEPGVTRDGNVDYFHLNSVGVDLDGNLLLSARNTWGIYKIDRRTGKVIWRLGGKRSDFDQGPGVTFAFQHDARRHADGTITLFDNVAGLPTDTGIASRSLRLAVNDKARTARLVHAFGSPDVRTAWAMGNAQQQPGGRLFVGWGMIPAFSELSAKGRVLFDARFDAKSVSYRAFRSPWVGRPTTRPDVATATLASGQAAVYCSWNGATEVARWQVLAGSSAGDLRVVRTVSRRGFETAVALPASPRYVAVVALDRAGTTLGRSLAVAV